jgi:hypothetical protein
LKLSKQTILLYCCCFFYASFLGQTKEDIQKLHTQFTQGLYTDFTAAHKNATSAVLYSKKSDDHRLEEININNK